MKATAIRRNGPDEKDEWVSIPQAQKLLGNLARHTLLARVLDGEFASKKVAGRRVISRQDVERAAGQRA
jgi:hypothetical protein